MERYQDDFYLGIMLINCLKYDSCEISEFLTVQW